ncbi:hypothetical protein CEP51_001645 [Fusarium floridanum]|uniref:Uncharacterized protein n=1 Tax=Fusarium floridanum TaxID=1325733 RepID=A0A428SFH5_9HYPO|nr:hypothetical protein CEP51_001645 [Fusarium floridanum]
MDMTRVTEAPELAHLAAQVREDTLRPLDGHDNPGVFEDTEAIKELREAFKAKYPAVFALATKGKWNSAK